MSATKTVNDYIANMNARLARRIRWRTFAAIALALLIVPLLTAVISSQLGFPDNLLIAGRLCLAVALALIVFFLWREPRKILRSDPAIATDKAAPELGGRIETFSQLAPEHPFRDLLAEEAAERLASYPPATQVPANTIRQPMALALVCLALLGTLIIAGPTNINFGLRDYFAGWLLPDMTPPTRLVVSPGDDRVRRGAAVRFQAQPEGFAPADARLNIKLGETAWESLPMTALADTSFDATLYAVNENLKYYVSAAGVRSETFTVDVVDLPNVETISVTYHYPEWTGLEARTESPASDLRAPPGTEIVLSVATVTPLSHPQIVIDGEPLAMTADANVASVRFNVEDDGRYFIGSMPGSNVVRLSDDYFISVVDDRMPVVRFERPGRDWKASNIEEVTTEVTVSDDYRVDSLLLHYAVNGGDWRSIELGSEAERIDAEHVFFLESIGDEAGAALVPGDLVSYYAEARDYAQAAQTDMFFIEVQPFDRRYSQSQQSGGQGGAGGLGDEISARQREIIVSTWNLIRQQGNATQESDDSIRDNANLLSELQITLREQARTLADRARARQLAESDDIAQFVRHLEAAAESMEPAAEELKAVRFQEALQPEQTALQHLLRAEAVFRDITVSMQNSNGAGGGQDSRDLSEMFELEMDLEKNQYETGSVASSEANEETLDEIAEKLRELARRQEKLNEQIANEAGASARERWEQERLQREAEELQRELQQLQRASKQQSASADGESGTQTEGSPSASGESGESGERSEPTAAERQREELEQRLDSALRAMRESSEALSQGEQGEAQQRAAAEAQRQLENAGRAAESARNQALNEELQALSAEAEALRQRQQRIEDRITESVAEALAGESDGLSYAEMGEIAQAKRDVHTDLESIEQRARDISGNADAGDPATQQMLDDALQQLGELRIKERIALSALYVERGEAQYIASSENMITESVEQLSQAIAQTAAASDDRSRRGSEATSLAQALDEVQALREALQQALQQGEPGQPGNALPTGEDVEQQARQAAATLNEALTDDRAVLNFDQASELRTLRRALMQSDPARNGRLLEAEARDALQLAEQLEVALREARSPATDAVQEATADKVPAAYEEAVWDYYRRLAEDASP